MSKVILNIGVSDKARVLQALSDFDVLCYRIQTNFGIWNEVEEVSQIVDCDIETEQLSELCVNLNEDAIAVYYPECNDGELIYNPEFKGDKIDFNVNYFNFPL